MRLHEPSLRTSPTFGVFVRGGFFKDCFFRDCFFRDCLVPSPHPFDGGGVE